MFSTLGSAVVGIFAVHDPSGATTAGTVMPPTVTITEDPGSVVPVSWN